MNHYAVGNVVDIHGNNFDGGTYNWAIWGNSGGSSGDPNDTVAHGTITINANGVATAVTGDLESGHLYFPETSQTSFCFKAYVVNWDDWGEYRFGIGGKNDNYRVDGLTGIDKSVVVTWQRTYNWGITKSASPTSLALFLGESAVSRYTVAVTKSPQADLDRYGISGTITINNTAPGNATVTVTDCLQLNNGGVWTNVGDCLSIFTTLTPGVNTHGYGFTDLQLDQGKSYRNAILLNGQVAKTVAIVFPAEPNSSTNNEIHVTDTNGGAWTFSAAGSQTYDKTFTCGSTTDSSTTHNVATISETSDTASADVTLACYDLAVAKTAATSYKRTFTWTVEKTNNTPTAEVAPGEQLTIGYGVTYNATGVNSDWAAAGQIVVTNNHPTRAATLTAITDALTGSIAGAVTCPALTVAAGGTLTCTYTASLPDATTRTNTATATQQLYTFDYAGVSTAGGTHDYTGTHAADFASATVNKVDECVSIADTYTGSGMATNLCDDATFPWTYEYSRTYTAPESFCGVDTVSNTANFKTNDTETEGSSTSTSAITVTCNPACTLTQGYWKTHSLLGPAPYDTNWATVGGSEAIFAHGISYYTNLWTAPAGGNAYYQLSHQYIAALLNVNNFSTPAPAEVQQAMTDAAALFANPSYTPDYIGGLAASSELRMQYLSLASTLGKYNEGTIGPGHCTER